MVTLTLQNDQTREFEKIEIKSSLVVAYDVEEIEGGWNEEEITSVYPREAVLEIDLGGSESLGKAQSQSPSPDRYVIE